ncbi:outer membrane protein assembly factor BamA [Chelativorans sp. ZYF759]|uniref:outer membrane protein assembly factor BamA n=1 Tax=Chelativorans sp. ZYF759 TaxID=2692213 RepID=UPI00145D0213|nr:outer membrane protein assembly factor BamA [Chelativorans sp. ZYF759]NMG41219.1 outer membrane protein assembly factor BamA [Chelativorans sp. ZYF759]
MKATSRFKSAASAAAISAGLIFSGAGALQFVGVTQAVAAVVSNVSVQGNERVEASTIRDYIGIVPGRNFTNTDIDEAVKRLFETGLFSDVRISQSGSTLVVQVTEYAIVNQVVFRGNRRVRDNQLTTATQLQPRRAFSQAALDADMEAIRAAYQRVGRGDVVIRPEVVNLGANRVNIVYDIQEGGRTRISSITFGGNTAFSDGRLREVITTKRSHILSWITRNDIYDEDRLRADEEALRTFYYNRGYADFQVISAVGELDEERNEYNIVFTINEGERYSYGAIEIDSTIPGVDAQALRRLLDVRQGNTYRAREVENSLVALTEHLAGMGYAFAQVTPRGDRDFNNRTISIVFQIDQGPRAYVERIEIRGNTRTRDYVIRREFDLVEGDAFNQVLVQRAARRLRDLDFFETVNVSTAPGSEADQVVLVVEVVEKATGEFSLGAGYTTGQSTAQSGFSVEGAIAERNFLGRGQSIRVSAGGGQRSRDFAFSFTEPYFLGQRISAGFDIFRSTRQFDKYSMESTGGTVRFGLPITQALTANLAYNFVQDQYRFRGNCDPDPTATGCNLSPILSDAIQNQSPWTRSSVSAGLSYNTIDNMRDPRTGIFANFNTEFAGLGGNARFVKFTGRGQYYHLLQEELDLVGVLTAGGGHVSSLGGGGLRVFDLFNSSERIIRGFDYNGIGPRDSATGDHLGATTYFHGSAELQFPFPAIPRDFGLRGALFADAATLYGSPFTGQVTGDAMAWRASVGVGVMWASPFGPLRLDYAFPVLKQNGDRVQNFSFGVSTRF